MPRSCDHLEINKAKMLKRSLNILATKEQLRSIGTKIIATAKM